MLGCFHVQLFKVNTLIVVSNHWFANRSIRRSVRSGSIKLKQTYEHLMENGDIGAMNRVSSSRSRPHDLDIKLLQAKRQQAEMRRFVIFFFMNSVVHYNIMLNLAMLIKGKCASVMMVLSVKNLCIFKLAYRNKNLVSSDGKLKGFLGNLYRK